MDYVGLIQCDPWELAKSMKLLLGPKSIIVRTPTVRCGPFRLGGTLVNPTQQVPIDGSLVVPRATLDSELQPV